MAGFAKFDPRPFLESEQRTAAGPAGTSTDTTRTATSAVTLATLATLAAQPAENEISNTEVCAATTGPDEQDKNQIQSPTPAKAAKVAKVQPPASASPYQGILDTLERRCPDFVETRRWRQAVEDGRRFLASWGEQANAFGWTARELFSLHTPPKRPAATYSRLSRYDETGLIWLLCGRPVIALTETVAAIQGATAVLTYRKLNKPALGPLGDSLDDTGAAT